MCSRRHFSTVLGLGLSAAGLLPLIARSASPGEDGKSPPRDLEVLAQRFKYTPDVLHVRAGETVTLLVTSLDFVHGMNFPDHGVRADLVPGQVVRITLGPKPAGRYAFVCDNFCGEGHEEMHGQIIVAG